MAGDTLAYVANYHPLVGHLIQQTGMVPILTAMLDDPNQDYGVDAGTVVAGLIHNILSSERIRLYRLSSFWHDPCSFPGVRRCLQRRSTDIAPGNNEFLFTYDLVVVEQIYLPIMLRSYGTVVLP